MNEPIEARLKLSASIAVSHPHLRIIADTCIEAANEIEKLKQEAKEWRAFYFEARAKLKKESTCKPQNP